MRTWGAEALGPTHAVTDAMHSANVRATNPNRRADHSASSRPGNGGWGCSRHPTPKAARIGHTGLDG